jgi:hypothetical protein
MVPMVKMCPHMVLTHWDMIWKNKKKFFFRGFFTMVVGLPVAYIEAFHRNVKKPIGPPSGSSGALSGMIKRSIGPQNS